MTFSHLKRNRLFQFMKFVYRRFEQIDVIQVSGSLTFTTLLALVPLLTMMLVVVAAFPMFADVSNRFLNTVNDILVPSGASVIMDYLNEFKDKANKLTTMSLLGMGVTSVLLIQTIEQTFNQIWRVRNARPLFMRIPIYWALLTLAPVVLGLGSSLTTRLQAYFPQEWSSVGNLPQLSLTVVVLYFAYRVVPNRYVPSKHALFGALIVAVALEWAKWGFGIYVRNFNSYELIYGVFAAVPVFLVWLHLLWSLVLTGAVLTASFSYWRGNAFMRLKYRNHFFDEAIAILLILKQAHTMGKSVSLPEFRRKIDMGYDELGDLLDELATHDYVSQEKNAWVLKKSADEISLMDLARIFVYTLPETQSVIHQGLSDLVQPCSRALAISLSEFERDYVGEYRQPELSQRLEKILADIAEQRAIQRQ